MTKNQKTQGFSLIELSISMIVIAIIIAALMPVISKRLTRNSTIKNRISTDCDNLYPDGYCSMCYITPKNCIVCTKNCQDDEYKNASDCICEKCSTRYNDPQCTKCNSNKCTQCNNGYYLDNNSKCTICPKGHFCHQQDNTSIKSPCEKGYSQPQEGQDKCIPCNKSTTTQTGTIAQNTAMEYCTSCDNGKYAKEEAQKTTCELCPQGHYCPQGKIIPCQKGYANDKLGQSICSSCTLSSAYIQGSTAPTSAMVSCSFCDNGSYSSDITQECKPCPQGYYCPQGKIIPCPKGYANNLTGQTTCAGCTKSSALTQGNYASYQGQTNCTACPQGYYAKTDYQTTACTICPQGYICPQGKFQQCPQGYYSATTGATTCSQCPSGTTSTQGSSGCSACSGNCSTCLGSSTNCTSCKAGYYLSGTGCSACSAKFSNCAKCSASACSECNSGYKVNNGKCEVEFDCAKAGGTLSGDYCWKRASNCNGITDGHTWRKAGLEEMKKLCKPGVTHLDSVYCYYVNTYHFSCDVLHVSCVKCIKSVPSSGCEMREIACSYYGNNNGYGFFSASNNSYYKFNTHHNDNCYMPSSPICVIKIR